MDKIAEKLEFEVGDDKKYKVKEIQDSIVYVKKLDADYLPSLYQLIF